MKAFPEYFRANIHRSCFEAAGIGSFLWIAVIAVAIVVPNPRSPANYMLGIGLGVLGLLLVFPLMGAMLGPMLVAYRWVRDRSEEKLDHE